jgi:hypothetical protein
MRYQSLMQNTPASVVSDSLSFEHTRQTAVLIMQQLIEGCSGVRRGGGHRGTCPQEEKEKKFGNSLMTLVMRIQHTEVASTVYNSNSSITTLHHH